MTDVITLETVTERIVADVNEAIEQNPETYPGELIFDVVSDAVDSWDWCIYTGKRVQLAVIAELELDEDDLDYQFREAENRAQYQLFIIHELLYDIAHKELNQ